MLNKSPYYIIKNVNNMWLVIYVCILQTEAGVTHGQRGSLLIETKSFVAMCKSIVFRSGLCVCRDKLVLGGRLEARTNQGRMNKG